MKNYTTKQMNSIRTLAFIQMKEGIYLISVPDDNRDIEILTPWSDETGRADFLTDREAISYWGIDLFTEFCEKALEYLDDDTVQSRF